MAARIIKLSPAPEQVFTLNEGVSHLGRGSSSDIQLVADGISRQHATIELVNGVATLADLDSTNGTFVNGDKVSKHKLKSGDEIRIADCVLRFEDADADSGDFVPKTFSERSTYVTAKFKRLDGEKAGFLGGLFKKRK